MSYFDANGKSVGCTVIEAGPCVVTQIKTNDTDGYSAMQIAFEEKKEKNTTASLKGHFAKSNTTPKKKLVEIAGHEGKNLGDTINILVVKGSVPGSIGSYVVLQNKK